MKYSLLIFLLILFSCNQQKQNISDCSEIKTPFKSYSEAKNTVKSVDFKFTDKVDTSKSSWIRSAKYYSCDGNAGYLVYTTDKKEYIHQDVPIRVWEEFKNADSFGKYYNKNIKKRYRLVPQNDE
ncbi:KTSC domain-containing protein [Chryseobacterium taklimakanense]|uniref:KTSC domain-containing protein n=1 Tax=Chryseobacterium taklimakanense TaxID=536441 RepID=A0A3G8WJR5_9FLAO|nr:KTSC domain-containing protein [Chryseobacterium taklimakanense]AZI20733.1 KTSC domain-containing protein [Chryseobacterium taklimakanense]